MILYSSFNPHYVDRCTTSPFTFLILAVIAGSTSISGPKYFPTTGLLSGYRIGLYLNIKPMLAELTDIRSPTQYYSLWYLPLYNINTQGRIRYHIGFKLQSIVPYRLGCTCLNPLSTSDLIQISDIPLSLLLSWRVWLRLFCMEICLLIILPEQIKFFSFDPSITFLGGTPFSLNLPSSSLVALLTSQTWLNKLIRTNLLSLKQYRIALYR